MSPSPFTRFRGVFALLAVAVRATAALAQAPGADASWSSVARLAAGTEITVTTAAPESAPYTVRYQRFVLRVDEAGLSTINLSGLPVSLVDTMLRDVAATHPEYFREAAQGRSRTLKHGVRIGPGGIFVSGRAVAPLQQILERIDRSDTVQIVKRRTIRRGSARRVLQGAALGFGMTLIAAANGGTGPNYCTRSERGCLAVAGAGLAAGAAAGYWGGKDRTIIEDEVVYRRR